ncbi:MAG: hypothetical protein D6756_00585 [Cyanobacteria bacterium J083]|nr:MAG: hypothetical protein D6756_00585 [Cyanobacteria bacterium J083]
MPYYLPQPPFFLLFIGLFIGISCGAAFEAVLKQKVKQWSQASYPNQSFPLDNFALRFTFFSTVLGVWIFLAAGFQIFGFSAWTSFAAALGFTLITVGLVWPQLNTLLLRLKAGGSAAIELDAYASDLFNPNKNNQ